MRFWGLLLLELSLLPLTAQPPAPVGLVHGTLIERRATAGFGELSIRTAANQVFRFAFDDKTYFEREHEHSAPGRLEKGDWLEIVSDILPGSPLPYARTVHVIERYPPARHRLAGMAGASHMPIEPVFPRGNLTFSGVVRRVTGVSLVLQTRADGEKTILLRPDTTFVAEGNPVEGSALEPNTRVFVRAGRNLDNQIEAYQIVWGEILEPR